MKELWIKLHIRLGTPKMFTNIRISMYICFAMCIPGVCIYCICFSVNKPFKLRLLPIHPQSSLVQTGLTYIRCRFNGKHTVQSVSVAYVRCDARTSADANSGISDCDASLIPVLHQFWSQKHCSALCPSWGYHERLRAVYLEIRIFS